MLELKNFSCGYGSKVIIKKINLRIEKKEFIGIIGPNGSGKTTLFRGITKSVNYHEGAVYFNEKNMQNMGFRDIAQNIAVVSREIPLTAMTVQEYVSLGRLPHYRTFQLFETDKDVELAEHCMEITGTLKFKDRYISQLSSGEAQLVLIARALTQEPVLLLLDEPTAHLDITHQMRILDLIKKLNREHNLTIIIVLHDLNLAAEYCDRLVLLNKGSIKNIGKPEDVLNYRDIEEVYHTVVVVEKNPISFKPFIFAVPEEVRKNCKR